VVREEAGEVFLSGTAKLQNWRGIFFGEEDRKRELNDAAGAGARSQQS
jgi:hypothetical protein